LPEFDADVEAHEGDGETDGLDEHE
jgi:hypothetical protein